MPIVRMPDGQLVEMPESPSPEQLAKLKTLSSSNPLARVADTVARAGRSVAAGFGEVAAGAPAALGMMPGMSKQQGQEFGELAGSVRDYWSEVGAKGLDGYPGAALKGVGGALAAPVGGPLATAAVGAGAGLGGEAAANAMGDTPMNRMAGGLLGGLAGGGAGALVGKVRPQTGGLVREGLEGLQPEDLAKAEAFMRSSAAQGVRVDLAQALEAVGAGGGNITTLRNTLANSKSGNAVQETLRKQPSELERLAETLVGSVPGTIRAGDSAANAVQDAATSRIQVEKGLRTKLWEDTLDSTRSTMQAEATSKLGQALTARTGAAADLALEQSRTKSTLQNVLSGKAKPDDLKPRIITESVANAQDRLAEAALKASESELSAVTRVPPLAVERVANKLRRLALDNPNTGKGQAIANLRRKLYGPDGQPLTDPRQLNDVLINEAARLKSIDLASKGVDAGAAKWIGLQIQEVRKDLGAAFVPTRKANEAYTAFTASNVDPLKKGVVGQMATRRGSLSDVSAADKLSGLLSKGESPGPTSNIRTLAQELQKTDPQAFPDAFKTYLQTRLGEAFPAKVAGAMTTAPEAATAVYTKLFANRNQYNGLRQAAAASAESLGADPAKVVKGLDSFAQITKALTNRPATVGGLSPRDATTMAGQNIASDSMRIFSFMPVEKAARRVEEAVMAKTYRELDKLLTTPEGVAKLAELGQQPVMSKKALTIFATIGGTTPGVVESAAGN